MPLDAEAWRLANQHMGHGPKTNAVADKNEAIRIIRERNRGTRPGRMNDALVYSPSEIKAEADTTNAIITQLYQDAAASPKIPTAVRNSFYAFCNEWVAFYKNHTSWFDRLWFSNLEKVTDYRKRADTWRKKLAAHGLASSSPADAIHNPGFDPNSIPWKWIAIGAAGLVGIFVVTKVVLGMATGGFAGALEEAEANALAIMDQTRRRRHGRSVHTIS